MVAGLDREQVVEGKEELFQQGRRQVGKGREELFQQDRRQVGKGNLLVADSCVVEL